MDGGKGKLESCSKLTSLFLCSTTFPHASSTPDLISSKEASTVVRVDVDERVVVVVDDGLE